MTLNPDEYLPVIEKIARSAGDVLMLHFRKLEAYEKKGSIDLVTIADREAEEHVISEILRHFPDHAVLGEEGGRFGNSESPFLWIVDPLDGTTNYAHGLRLFAVSVGLTLVGEPIAGAVNAPALDELYLAARGHGATRNGERLRVSQTDSLGDALIVTGFPYNRRDYMDELSGMHRACLEDSRGVLRLGAASLDFANVAAGHLEAFYEFGLRPWDMAAGALLVTEAGGRITGLRETEPFDLFRARCVASNGRIHEALQRTLARGGVERLPIASEG